MAGRTRPINLDKFEYEGLGSNRDIAGDGYILISVYMCVCNGIEKHGAGHLRGSRLSSLFKHFLRGFEKAQTRNFSIVSDINIIIVVVIIIITR